MKTSICFGNTTEVPVLGMGTWNMGESPTHRSEEIQALRRGIELGMHALDTAEMYGDGYSEILVGEAIRGLREKVFLISKVLPSHASRRGTVKACEESLKRLATDRLDLYLLHWQGGYPFEETVEAMLKLQKEGKIRYWGVSNMDIAKMDEFFRVPGGSTCAANEVLYNLKHRGIEYDLLPWCRKHRLPVIAYSPIEQGHLSENPVLSQIGHHHNATPAQIALAWILRQPGVLAIPKAATVRHVEENFKSLSIQLSPDELKNLDEAFPAPSRKHWLEMI